MTLFQAFRAAGVAERLSVADVYRLQEEGVISDGQKFELIDGEIIPMAAAKSNGHEKMKQALVRAIARILPDHLGLFVETSITIDDFTYVEPDICIFDLKHDTREVRGADMLLAIEVASSSLGYDLLIKRDLYAGFGVGDYWVIDIDRQVVRVHRRPDAGRYHDVQEYERDQEIQALLVPLFEVRLAALRGR